MSEPTQGVADPTLASDPSLPFDLAAAETVTYDDVFRLRAAVYGSEGNRRRFLDSVERVEGAVEGNATEKAWRRGAGLFIAGRYEDAAEALRKARSHADATHLLGRALALAGRVKEAVDLLEDAVRERATDARVRGALFEAYERAGDFDALAKGVKSPPKSFEESADLAYFEGRLAERAGRREEAVAAYERALSRDPEHRGALFRLARELDFGGMDEEAIALYERLARLKPVDAAVLVNLGLLYEDRGDYDRAVGCFETILKVDATHERARLFRTDAAAALSMYYDEDEEKKEDKLQQILRTPITDFELSVRARNCLQKMEIHTLADLVRKTEAELLAYKNFGETSLNEIRELLTVKGLRLGMLRDQTEADAIRRMELEAAERRIEMGDEQALAAEEAEQDAKEERADALARPFGDLVFSARTKRSLEGLELKTVGDLAAKTEDELAAIPNFGATAIVEVREKLKALGLELGVRP